MSHLPENSAAGRQRLPSRRWRDYRTATGRAPIRDFVRGLSKEDALAITIGMAEVQRKGLRERNVKHLRGGIWEVRIDGVQSTYRVLFAREGKRVLLALEAFEKKTQHTPLRRLELANQRLSDWRRRGAARAGRHHTHSLEP